MITLINWAAYQHSASKSFIDSIHGAGRFEYQFNPVASEVRYDIDNECCLGNYKLEAFFLNMIILKQNIHLW